ncbi:hypothetical protein ABT030_38945 [Streptomyces mirabilis]
MRACDRPSHGHVDVTVFPAADESRPDPVPQRRQPGGRHRVPRDL